MLVQPKFNLSPYKLSNMLVLDIECPKLIFPLSGSILNTL